MVGLGSGFILNFQLVASSDTLPELWCGNSGELQYGCLTYQHTIKPAHYTVYSPLALIFCGIRLALLTVLANFDTVKCCHVTFMCKLSPSVLLSYGVLLLLLLLLLLPFRLLLLQG